MKANVKKQAEKKQDTITIGRLLRARATIETLADSKVNLKLSLKIFKFRKATENTVEFYQQQMQRIVEQYGEKKDGKQTYDDRGNALIDKTKIEDCRTAISELENTGVEMPDIRFEVDELEEVKLSANDIATIEKFIIGG